MVGYYYCSLGTFLNIIKNKQIYLSDPLKMNDSLEIMWYLNKLNEERKENEFVSVFDLMKMRSNIDFTFEELVVCLESKGQSSIYISCFSKESDMLSQWRAYADDGKGVSIGFDLDELARNIDNILIEEVIYTNKVVQDKSESDVEVVADQIGTVLSNNNITDREEQIEVFIHELIPDLAKYKNPAFSEESEIRLIYCDDLKFETIVDSYGAFSEEWKPQKLEHDFRIIGNSNITEFVKLNFETNSIKDIIIGPKCSLSENDVKNMIKKLLAVEKPVIKSESSYR